MSTGTAAADGPKLRLGVIFYLAEKRGRTARPPAGSYHDNLLVESGRCLCFTETAA